MVYLNNLNLRELGTVGSGMAVLTDDFDYVCMAKRYTMDILNRLWGASVSRAKVMWYGDLM